MNAQEYAEIFKALSHPIRITIACGLLNKGKCNVNTISERLQISQSLASQHINILKKADIITGSRDGNIIWYKISNPLAIKLLSNIDLHICNE